MILELSEALEVIPAVFLHKLGTRYESPRGLLGGISRSIFPGSLRDDAIGKEEQRHGKILKGFGGRKSQEPFEGRIE